MYNKLKLIKDHGSTKTHLILFKFFWGIIFQSFYKYSEFRKCMLWSVHYLNMLFLISVAFHFLGVFPESLFSVYNLIWTPLEDFGKNGVNLFWIRLSWFFPCPGLDYDCLVNKSLAQAYILTIVNTDFLLLRSLLLTHFWGYSESWYFVHFHILV